MVCFGYDYPCEQWEWQRERGAFVIYNKQDTGLLIRHLLLRARQCFGAGGLIRVCLPNGISLTDVIRIDGKKMKCRRGGQRHLLLLDANKHKGDICTTYICLGHMAKGYARLVLTNRRSKLVPIPSDLAWQALFDVVDVRGR